MDAPIHSIWHSLILFNTYCSFLGLRINIEQDVMIPFEKSNRTIYKILYIHILELGIIKNQK